MLLNAPPGPESLKEGPLRSLLEALNNQVEVKLHYIYSGLESVILIFRPLHFIYTPETHLIFGTLRDEQRSRYVILHGERIQKLAYLDSPVNQPDYVYVQTTGNQDIEILVSQRQSDMLLVFTLQPGTGRKKTLAEYALLAQTEVYPIPQPIHK
ncbi:hypothetical protein [Treponema primitia]|uniref:hypothetical protein n=1 Tax=Treponema primitia TaxID=88058 RepID=UPI0012FD3477|nr:hypothetical protein [Treponema primitia]